MVPVTAAVFSDGRLRFRLSVMQSGRAPRAPTANEVRSLAAFDRRLKTVAECSQMDSDFRLWTTLKKKSVSSD